MTSRHPTATEREQRLVINETFRVLTHWAPKWKRAKDRAVEIQHELAGLEKSHPEWIFPDMRQVVTHIIVLVGLPCIALLDGYLIGAVAEFLATLLFPHSSLLVVLTRILIPALFVGFEIVIAVLTASAREMTVWDGSQPERKLFTRVGWGMVAVTPLMVIAALLAGVEQISLGFLVLAFMQALLGALLHVMVVSGGHWIREALAFAFFRLKRLACRAQLERAEKKIDGAAEQVRVAYPVFETAYSSYLKGLPAVAIIGSRLPIEVLAAIKGLFGSDKVPSLELQSFNEEGGRDNE